MAQADVIAKAKKIVMGPPSEWGFSDVGDVLVRYLCEDIPEDRAMQELNHLEQDYARDPRHD